LLRKEREFEKGDIKKSNSLLENWSLETWKSDWERWVVCGFK